MDKPLFFDFNRKNKFPVCLKNRNKKRVKKKLKFKSILIVTYGRSGSTLLQGVLNSIEGCLIRGENFNFIYHLFKSHEAIKSAKNKGGDTPQKAWYGSQLLDGEYFIKVNRELLKKLLLADDFKNANISCYGFKEIRYIDIMDNLFEYLDFLKKIFPDVAFIFNFRNKNEVAKSDWWENENKKEVKEKLKRFERKCSEYMKVNHGRCFLIKYEDLVYKKKKLKDMFEFLGAEYIDSKIDHILSLPHSYNPKQKHVKDLFGRYNKMKEFKSSPKK